jgi:hypothetical protein
MKTLKEEIIEIKILLEYLSLITFKVMYMDFTTLTRIYSNPEITVVSRQFVVMKKEKRNEDTLSLID